MVSPNDKKKGQNRAIVFRESKYERLRDGELMPRGKRRGCWELAHCSSKSANVANVVTPCGCNLPKSQSSGDTSDGSPLDLLLAELCLHSLDSLGRQGLGVFFVFLDLLRLPLARCLA